MPVPVLLAGPPMVMQGVLRQSQQYDRGTEESGLHFWRARVLRALGHLIAINANRCCCITNACGGHFDVEGCSQSTDQD